MKHIFLLMAFGAQMLSAVAQPFTVSGQLRDSLTNEPDPYATVRLYAGEPKPVAVAVTDAEGRFSLKISRAGRFRLLTSIIGKAQAERTVSVGPEATAVSLGIILTHDAKELNAAEVVAARPLVTSQIDRLSYSMADDPDAQTNTMLEMLRKVPLVTVDGQDNISVNGQSSFRIYVNGKPNKMMTDNPSAVLKAFPANVVKRVEVITDPGAKEDAEGVSGILNIVTATEASTSGWTATPNISWSNRGMGGNVYAMVQTGKLTLSANGGVNRQTRSRADQSSERETFANPVNHLLTSHGTSRQRSLFGFGGLDASYEFSKKDLLSASASLFAGRPKGHGPNYVEMSGEGGTVYSYTRLGTSRQTMHGLNTSVDFQHQFAKPEQNLTLSYRYSSNRQKQENRELYADMVNVPFTLQDQLAAPDNSSQEHTVQADFTTPLGKIHTLSVGSKYIYRLNRSDNEELTRTAGSLDEFLRDDDRSLFYRHRNGILSGYAEYMLKLTRFSLRSGLRFESSHISATYPRGGGEKFGTTLNDLVPSLNLAYNFTPTQMLRMGYSLRIARPDIAYLTPYVDRTTPERISYGNPNLTSARSHNLSANYSYFTPKFSVNATASYAFSVNGLTFYSFLDADGVENSTSGNFLHSRTAAVSLFANWMPRTGTTLTLNGEGNFRRFLSHRTADSNRGFGGGFFAMLRQDLPWHLKLNVGGGHQRGPLTLQGRSSGFSFHFGSLSRSFLKDDRLTVNLNCFNPFAPTQTFRNTTRTQDFSYESRFTQHGFSRFSIGLSWRFGKLQAVVKRAARTISNDDVEQGSPAQSTQQNQGQEMGGM